MALLLLIAVPMVEIALFVTVGGAIGLWPTLAIVAVTALAGLMMLRAQGVAAMRALQTAMERDEDPSEALAGGALLLMGGVLLITPGFFTDVLGLALLSPAARGALVRWLGPRLAARRARRAPRRTDDDAPIEAEYRDVTDNDSPPGPPLEPPRR